MLYSKLPGLNLKNLTTELSSVKEKWHEIGIQLSIELSDLNTIEEQHSRIERRFSEMLAFWLDRNTKTPVCWESILGALKSPTVNKRWLAEKLHKKFVECPVKPICNGELRIEHNI